MKVPKKKTFLYEFYGAESPECKAMESLVKRLEKEEKIKVERLEVLHNDKNKDFLMGLVEIIEEAFGELDLPTFYNKKTGAVLCGEQDYETLKAWASGKKEEEESSYIE